MIEGSYACAPGSTSVKSGFCVLSSPGNGRLDSLPAFITAPNSGKPPYLTDQCLEGLRSAWRAHQPEEFLRCQWMINRHAQRYPFQESHLGGFLKRDLVSVDGVAQFLS